MDKKRHLKKFENQSTYESQKDVVMGKPHVVLLAETKKVVYVPKTKEVDYSKEYFTLHAISDGDMTLYRPSSYTSCSLAYSVNDGEWVNFDAETTLTLVTDDEVKVKCIANAYTRRSDSPMFGGTCEYEVYGNVMSLLYGDDFEGQSVLTTQYSLRALFYNQTNLKNAENLILQATTLVYACYQNMFRGCSSLTTAPQLPSTTLDYCCYDYMFRDCTSLVEAPELPATTLVYACYQYMFYGCTSLTKAPQLPATTLADSCYQLMFYNCSNLNYIKMLATDISANGCLFNWVSGVASSGTFVKNAAMTSLPNGASGIPEEWDVQVVTPSIGNTLSKPIDFNYNEGMFTPTVTVELTKIMSEENILSLQPMCDITVNVINKDNSLHTSDYLMVWC